MGTGAAGGAGHPLFWGHPRFGTLVGGTQLGPAARPQGLWGLPGLCLSMGGGTEGPRCLFSSNLLRLNPK